MSADGKYGAVSMTIMPDRHRVVSSGLAKLKRTFLHGNA